MLNNLYYKHSIKQSTIQSTLNWICFDEKSLARINITNKLLYSFVLYRWLYYIIPEYIIACMLRAYVSKVSKVYAKNLNFICEVLHVHVLWSMFNHQTSGIIYMYVNSFLSSYIWHRYLKTQSTAIKELKLK